MTRARPAWCLALVTCLVACSSEPPLTEVIVNVRADPGVAGDTRFLEISVVGASSFDALDRDEPEVRTFERTRDVPLFPYRVALVPANGDAQRVYEIVARALNGAATPLEITRARLRSGYVPGRVVHLDLLLQDACVGRSCPDDLTCVDGACVDPTVDPAPDAGVDAGPGADGGPLRDGGGVAMDGGVGHDAMIGPRRDAGPDFDGGGGACPGGCPDNGDLCDGPEHCDVDRCVSGPALSCNDSVGCTNDSCDPATGCRNMPDDALCTAAPGGTCNLLLDCQYTMCSPTTCASDACFSAFCSGATCSRTALCTMGQECCGGACVAAGCDDGNPCTADRCDISGCVNTPQTGPPCSDGSLCTGSDSCVAGTCMGGSPIMCPPSPLQCHENVCMPATGCTDRPLADGTICTDGDPCTEDACTSGACSPSFGCEAGDVCQVGRCIPAFGCILEPRCLDVVGAICNPATGECEVR